MPTANATTVQHPAAMSPTVETLRRKMRTAPDGQPPRSARVRWGSRDELFQHGFLVVPTKFFESYAALQPPLTPGEALFVLQLMTFKWEEAAPFPSYLRIAERMGISDKMARCYARSLSLKGYLRREYRHRAANRFDLSGLFAALATHHVPVRGPAMQEWRGTDEIVPV